MSWAVLPGGPAVESQEAQGSTAMETIGKQLALSGPHLLQLQNELWRFCASQSSMEAKPKAKGQVQRKCLAQVTSCHRAVVSALCPQLAGSQPDLLAGSPPPTPTLSSPGCPRSEGLSQQLGGVKILALGAQFFSFSF